MTVVFCRISKYVWRLVLLQLVIGLIVVYRRYNVQVLPYSNNDPDTNTIVTVNSKETLLGQTLFKDTIQLRHTSAPDRNGTRHTHSPDHIKQCVKQRNIVFVKVHKTGSTTAWGIFARFARNNSLNVVLPVRESGAQFNYLSAKNVKLSESILPPPPGETYNILCNHAIYNKTQFENLMPADTVRIGIVRDPIRVVKSAFFYFGLFNAAKSQLPSTEGHMILHKFLKNKIYNMFDFKRPLFNGMSYDFGIPMRQLSNTSYVLNYINMLDKDFKLVIVAEYFDESLVLMRRLLCWDFRDIIYLTQNKGAWRTNVNPNVTSNDTERLTALSKTDQLLYNFFKVKLLNQIRNEGPNFENEVRHFKNVTQQIRQYCYATERVRNGTMVIPHTEWNRDIYINGGLCNQLLTSEIGLVRQMIRQAKKKLGFERGSVIPNHR